MLLYLLDRALLLHIGIKKEKKGKTKEFGIHIKFPIAIRVRNVEAEKKRRRNMRVTKEK